MICSDDCSFKIGLVLVDYCSSPLYLLNILSTAPFFFMSLLLRLVWAVVLIVIMIMVAVIMIIEMVVVIFSVRWCVRKLRTPFQIPLVAFHTDHGNMVRGEHVWAKILPKFSDHSHLMWYIGILEHGLIRGVKVNHPQNRGCGYKSQAVQPRCLAGTRLDKLPHTQLRDSCPGPRDVRNAPTSTDFSGFEGDTLEYLMAKQNKLVEVLS